MDRAVFVYTTFPSLVEAEAAAKDYRWEGKLERAGEVVAIFKTRASLADEVRQAVRDNHSREVPAIAVIALESVDRDYFGWILNSTKAGE